MGKLLLFGALGVTGHLLKGGVARYRGDLVGRAAKRLKAGDLLLFYLSKNERLEWSQSLTTIGIVERQESTTHEDLIRMTAKRSVFSAAELTARQNESTRPMKVIDFLLAGHSTPPVPLSTLVREGI